jgi:diphosphate-dependent phosphofructokinase
MKISPLQKARYDYNPKLPQILRQEIHSIIPVFGNIAEPEVDREELKGIFPNTYGKPTIGFTNGKNEIISKKRNVGVILSGGQAPGGHNVIAGLFDAIKNANPESKLFGFRGGPSGILENDAAEITSEFLDPFRNSGGFDIIGSGRTKLETEEQFAICVEVCKKREISSLVVIGGDDSNTNAAVLAEYFAANNSGISVIGAPKTIDGDLKNEAIEVSFGFDTATKTYSELIGNIARDANSAKKYWHFIKLMGRSASHIALECALQTQPNIALISEEIEENQTTLKEIVEDIAKIVVERSRQGNNFGLALVPEGLIEFIPEMKILISELNDLMAEHSAHFSTLNTFETQAEWINANLTKDSSYAFSSLPNDIQRQLLMDRDPHGNVQVSRIETEKLLIEMVENRLKEWKNEGTFNGKFSAQHHFFGYEGRCAFPSNFDADYCYSLGYNAFMLIASEITGYISSISNLSAPAVEWKAGGIPVTMMMNLEQRHGSMKPVIKKALVELDGNPFKEFAENRKIWALETRYTFPGAIQYYGPAEVCDQPTITLSLEQQGK